MKICSWKETLGWFVVCGVRALERILPPFCLALVLWPPVAVATSFELAKGRPGIAHFQQLPASLRPAAGRLSWAVHIWWRLVCLNLAKLLCLWPDRLHTARWRQRCRCRGLDQFEAACALGRPVILAFLHFGPISVLRYWLRAGRREAATVAVRPEGGRSLYRAYLDRLSDASSGLAGISHVFGPGQLKPMYRFLQPHRILLIAVDGDEGRQVLVPGGDFSFRIAIGAVRLAAKVNGVVVPCLISGDRALGVTLHFGTPAPAAQAADAASQEAACAHLLREFLPILRAHPEQFTFQLMSHVVPAARGPLGVPS